MKKILLIMFLFISFIGLLGCENKNCLVTFSIDSEEQIIEINKGTILNYNLVTSYEEDVIEGLYYDENYTLKYDYKEIKDDITIYVKTKKVEVTFVIVHEYKKVLINKNSQITKEVLSKVVDTNLIEGLYYDPLYTNKYNNELIKQNTQIYVDIIMDINNMKQVGMFYTLEEAYNNNYIDLNNFYEIKYYCETWRGGYKGQDVNNPCKILYPEWISEDLNIQIIMDFIKCYNCDEDHDISYQLGNTKFFGRYNDCLVVAIPCCGPYVAITPAKYKMGVHEISLREGPLLCIWKPIESDN